jgi:uncharacterized protein (DUF302 family)
VNAIEATVTLAPVEAEAAIRATLAEHGFGVLTEIDVAATLKAKLGVDRAPLKILGACNPSFAHRALQIDPSVSLLLPCNVVIGARPGGGSHIAIADPRGLFDDPRLTDLAGEAAEQLERAVAAVPTSAS